MAPSGGGFGTSGNKQYVNVDTAEHPQGDEEAPPDGAGQYTAVSTTSPACDEKKYSRDSTVVSSSSLPEGRQVAECADQVVNI